MSATETKQTEIKTLSRGQIVDNENLADKATGIDSHPEPLTQTRPLVDPSDQAREFPYGK